MLQLFVTTFITIRFLDVIDVLLVAILLYEVYKLIKGTAAINIFLGVIAFILLGVFLPSWWNDVPFYPTSPPVITHLTQMLPNDCAFRFIDCGCGFGSVLFQLAKKFPRGTFIGVEVSPILAFYGLLRSLLVPNVSIKWTNLWQEPLSNYNYIYAFLSPEVSEQLAIKIADELATNSSAIINSFKLPDSVSSSLSLNQVKVSNDTTLYIYRCL